MKKKIIIILSLLGIGLFINLIIRIGFRTILDTWNINHMIYHKSSDLFKVLHEYIKNKKTSDEVYEFLNEQLSFYQNYDISRKSHEIEQMKLSDLYEERINVYYNLTPEEKMEIDKYDWRSDDWINVIDAKKELKNIYDTI